MKLYSHLLALAAAAFLFPLAASADEDDSEGFGVRLSAEADYRIRRGLHISASEEIRLGGKYIMDRSYTQVGLSYKFTDWLKAGVSYTAIAVYKSDVTEQGTGIVTHHWYDWRHRVSADVTATLKAGQWRFSLRERFQATYKTRSLNNYQQPQTALALRSRIKAAYKFRSVPLEPYAFVESRLMLNGAGWSAESVTEDYASAVFLGHNDVYMNRLRGAIGLEWQLDSRNSIDFYGFYDHLTDKEIDARKEGSAKGVGLKAAVYDTVSNRVSLGVAYRFSF